MSAAKGEGNLVPTVREVQQMLADILGHGDDITWDLISSGQENILKAKLSQLHCESNMFRSIWSYRKYSKGQSLTSLFFVMLVDNVYDSKMAEESRSWRLYPVFRCRRCVDETGHSSNVDCCMSYVSQYSIADSWKRFVTHTSFGAGIMVTPNLGVYKQIDGRVELKTYSTTQMCYPNMEDKPITPESLKKASRMTIKHRKIIIQSDPFMVFPEAVYDFCAGEKMLSSILNPHGSPQPGDVPRLSDSLVLFTNNLNNLRLGSLMNSINNDPSILGNQQRSAWDKIAEESIKIEGNVNLIRSCNGVPPKAALDKIFQPIDNKRKKSKKRMEAENPENTQNDLSENGSIKIKGHDINLREYGTQLKEHIANSESFDILIGSMSEHLEVDTFKLIMELTQTFVETVREEMCQTLKYYFPTESIIFQIILCISKHHPKWDFNEIEEHSSDILRRVRMFFVSTGPNPYAEFLKKCEVCAGYYDICKLT